MKDKLFEIVANVMGIPVETVTMESSPDSIEAWDSLKHMNLVLALEQAFAIQFSDEQIVEFMNVEIIAATIIEGVKGA